MSLKKIVLSFKGESFSSKLSSRHKHVLLYKYYFKPFLDLFCAVIALLLSVPLLVIISIVLFITNNGKTFFLQKRVGKNGKIFKVIKFKTMNDNKDVFGELLPDEDRLTGFGKFIRKTSLDELPQLLNVIKGDMSLVGPRPLLVEYLPLYNNKQQKRHLVKPGITGWAQVNGRNAISWHQKFEYDVWYVENTTFLLDVKIIGLTIIKALKSEGIHSSTSVTMEKYKGNSIF